MSKKILLICLGAIFLLTLVPIEASTISNLNYITNSKNEIPFKDWEIRINANADDGNTFCYIGEKLNASNGVDKYDVPHPPFFPPGRAWLFLKEPNFPIPYKNLLYEYKKGPDTIKIFNLTTYLDPIDGTGKTITLTWNKSQFKLPEYKTASLMLNNIILVNMKNVDKYEFWSDAYQMTYFKIQLSNLPHFFFDSFVLIK